MGREWFETFFEGIPLELWEKAVALETTRAEVDFVEQSLAAAPGARLLDVACGFGRHSLELAARGYRLTGIDISHSAIERASAYARQAGQEIEFVRDDIRHLDRVSEFDGILWFGNSFGYFQHVDTQRILAALVRAVRPGGRFVLQTGAVAECLLPRFREREWSPVESMLFLEDNRYRPEASCVDTTYIFVRDGNVETRTGQQLIYTVAELVRMLEASGLRVEGLLGSLDRRALKLGDDILYVIAGRPAEA